MSGRRIGLLGGTFDPIHFGHINLGIEMQEKHALDTIFVCPAAASPLKIDQAPLVPKELRLQMVKLGVEGIPGWQVLDWEIKRNGVSYTIDTVRAIHSAAEKNQEKIELFLLLGEDTLGQLNRWKEVEELLRLAPPLIGVRGQGGVSGGLSRTLEEICQKGRTKTLSLEISSTLIRERLKRKLYCGHLLPAKVLDFIYLHQLYLH